MLPISLTLCHVLALPFMYIHALKCHDSSMKAPLASFPEDEIGSERLRDLPKAASGRRQGKESACSLAPAQLPLGFH